MEGDACSEGCGFESQHCIQGWIFFTLFFCKICNVCLKKANNKQKRVREWPIKKHLTLSLFLYTHPFSLFRDNNTLSLSILRLLSILISHPCFVSFLSLSLSLNFAGTNLNHNLKSKLISIEKEK